MPYVLEGAYTTNFANGENACKMLGWADGAVENAIVRYRRDAATQASAVVDGLPGARIGLLVGAAELSGTSEAASVTLARSSSKKEKAGDCDFSWRIRMTVEFEGTTAVGKVFYEQVANKKDDCPAILCTNIQTTRGTKVP